MSQNATGTTRREFLKAAGQGAAVSAIAAGFPAIVPASVLGASAPSNRINVGAIGTGRISRGHDLPGIWKYDTARIMAVCDLDSHRVEDAKTLVNGYYAKKTGKPYTASPATRDYHELLANKDIDAVVISTPDHWHAIIAIDAVAGRQGRLPAEAGVADDRRRARAERRRPPLRAHLPDRQPAALVAAVPLRRGAGAQRPHRPAEDGGGRPARRSVRRRRTGDAGAEEPELRHVARLDAGRALHREARPSAERLRPSGLAALRAVRRRHDHRLGRAPHRQRALGHGHRIHRPGRGLGHGGVPDEGPVGRPRPFQDRGALRQRRAHDRQRRLPERHQVHRHRRAGSSSRAATKR